MRLLLCFSVLLVPFTARTASAQPGAAPFLPAPADRAPAPAVERYYSHTLMVDGLGFLSLVGGGLAEGDNGRDTATSDMLFAIGGVVSVFGSPIVHASHGEWGNAGLSLLMRATIPSIMGGVAMAMNRCDDREPFDLCKLDSFGPGVVLGFALVSLLDATYLAKRTAKPRRKGIIWAPQLGVGQRGASIGLAAAW